MAVLQKAQFVAEPGFFPGLHDNEAIIGIIINRLNVSLIALN